MKIIKWNNLCEFALILNLGEVVKNKQLIAEPSSINFSKLQNGKYKWSLSPYFFHTIKDVRKCIDCYFFDLMLPIVKQQSQYSKRCPKGGYAIEDWETYMPRKAHLVYQRKDKWVLMKTLKINIQPFRDIIIAKGLL